MFQNMRDRAKRKGAAFDFLIGLFGSVHHLFNRSVDDVSLKNHDGS